MTTLDLLAQKMDQLPNKADLNDLETKLTNKLHQNTMRFEKKVQDNSREIRDISHKLEKQTQVVARLEQEIDKQKRSNTGRSITTAQQGRKEAYDDRYLRSRRSFKIWPLSLIHI